MGWNGWSLDGPDGLGENDLKVVHDIYGLSFIGHCPVNLEVIYHILLTKMSLIIRCTNILSAIRKENKASGNHVYQKFWDAFDAF